MSEKLPRNENETGLKKQDGEGLLVELDSETGIFTDASTGEQYAPSSFFDTGDLTPPVIKRQLKGVALVPGKMRGKKKDFYNIEQAKLVFEIFLKLPKVNKDGVYIDQENIKWVTIPFLIGYFKGKADRSAIESRLEGVASIPGRNKKEEKCRLYKFADVEKVIAPFANLPQVDERGIFTDEETGTEWAAEKFFRNKEVGQHVIKTLLVDHKVGTKEGKDKNKHERILYNVEEVLAVVENYLKLPRVDVKTGIYTDPQGEEWAEPGYFFDKEADLDRHTVKRRLDVFARSIDGRNWRNEEAKLFHVKEGLEGIKKPILRADIEEKARREGERKKELDAKRAPAGWLVEVGIVNLLGKMKIKRSRTSVQKAIQTELELFPEKTKEWINADFYNDFNQPATHYHPDLIARVVERVQEEEKKKIPGGWLTKTGVKKFLEEQGITASDILLDSIIPSELALYPDKKDEWVKKGWVSVSLPDAIHYHPDFIAKLVERLKQREQKVAPEGWLIVGGIVKLLNEKGLEVSEGAVVAAAKEILGSFSEKAKEWTSDEYLNESRRLGSTHYHPDLVKKIVDYFEQRGAIGNERYLNKEREEKLVDYVIELKNSGLELDDFNKFLNILGSSQVVDILYRLHPEFKGLRVEFVKGIMAEYLGDFLMIKNDFKLKDFKTVAEKLPTADLTTQERFYEALKNHCLQYYFSQSHHKHGEGSEIIYGYIDYITSELGDIHNAWLDDVVEKVITYYDSVLKDFHKPEGFVDKLDSDREFPDINQRINMKELVDKKRLLIADEMGLGKSASVIMAKEQLGVKCALVVAPSNVVATWERYLSEEGKKGYFEAGKEPRVLVVEDAKDLNGVKAEQYDYILISQEKMTDRYTPTLKDLDYDMLIIDEVHKLKNPDAVRTQGLLPLAEKIQGDNKYLALLSGTPVPNKIRDVGTLLQLLYPEKFAGIDNKVLTRQIISGEIEELRDYLIPRMQMKSLEEGVEMPELKEEVVEVELSELEKEVYEVLLEEDEIPPAEKMRIMRQFLLNPELIESTPNFEGAKIKALREDIKKAFQEHDKVVLFINGYVEGIIRGEGNIIGQLDVPPDVTVKTIHGDNKSERGATENQFQNTDERMLLIVSGSTADVGVNFSRGQKVLMGNEPWTVSDKDQEIARVYRFGLEDDLTVQTYVTKGTIEEGIHEYIIRKDKAIQKLLRGIPLSEREQELLRQDEKQGELDPDQEINPDLARYYFSSWDKLMQFFSYIKEQGEENFNAFLEKYGVDYADAYMNMGSRSYQSNINRIAGTLFAKFIEKSNQDPKQVKILDIASGPEMLRRHIGDTLQKSVASVDVNQHHFPWEETEEGRRIVNSWAELPSPNITANSVDYVNLAMSLHYTSFAPSRGDYERVKVLQSINRVLKPGGKAVISMIYSTEMRDMDAFRKSIEVLGFKIVDGFTGTVEAGNQFSSQIITLEKVVDSSDEPEAAVEKMGDDYNGLKFDRVDKRLKDSRKVFNAFTLADHGYVMELNKQDQAVLKEETEVTEEGKRLKQKYGDIKSIPAKEIIDNNFVRILAWNKYVLFKKLKTGSGVVIVK